MKYEYIGEQSITLHGIGEAGARMSEIKLPAPVAVWRGDHTFHLNPEGMRLEGWRDHALYSAEQVRQAVLAERERAAKVAEALEGIAGPTVHDIARAIRRG